MRLDLMYLQEGSGSMHSIQFFTYGKGVYPNTHSNLQSSLSSVYRNHKCDKKTREWVREVENGSFTPLVFSSIGGMGVEASTFFKRMAELIASKTGKNCSEVMHVICCRLIKLFTFMISSACIRGSQSAKRKPLRSDNFDVIHITWGGWLSWNDQQVTAAILTKSFLLGYRILMREVGGENLPLSGHFQQANPYIFNFIVMYFLY